MFRRVRSLHMKSFNLIAWSSRRLAAFDDAGLESHQSDRFLGENFGEVQETERYRITPTVCRQISVRLTVSDCSLAICTDFVQISSTDSAPN